MCPNGANALPHSFLMWHRCKSCANSATALRPRAPMLLNHTTHTFSRPGITNYSHTYMTSGYFPSGVESMSIFLSFIIFLLFNT